RGTYTFTINRGDTYEILNETNTSYMVDYGNGLTEYIVDELSLDKKGQVYGGDFNAKTTMTYFPSKFGKRVTFTSNNSVPSIRVTIPIELKPYLKITKGYGYFLQTVNTGTTIQIGPLTKYFSMTATNYTSSSKVKASLTDSNGDYYLCEMYDVSITPQVIFNEGCSINLTAGGSYIVYAIPIEFKNDIKVISTPALVDNYLTKGIEYKYVNNKNNNIILNFYTKVTDSSYKSIIYDKNGNITGWPQQITGSVVVPPGGKAIITCNNNETVLIPGECRGLLTRSEDINADGNVTIVDLSIMGTLYNKKIGDKSYNIGYDLNSSKIIDIYDLVRVAKSI
ncbi:MAG: hypothetical protein ACRC7N_08655, partial [Clostridium sp.]